MGYIKEIQFRKEPTWKLFWSFFTSIYLSLFCFTSVSGQTITFEFSDGNQSNYPLEEISKITFSGSIMNLVMESDIIHSWDIESIKHFGYND